MIWFNEIFFLRIDKGLCGSRGQYYFKRFKNKLMVRFLIFIFLKIENNFDIWANCESYYEMWRYIRGSFVYQGKEGLLYAKREKIECVLGW